MDVYSPIKPMLHYTGILLLILVCTSTTASARTSIKPHRTMIFDPQKTKAQAYVQFDQQAISQSFGELILLSPKTQLENSNSSDFQLIERKILTVSPGSKNETSGPAVIDKNRIE